MASKTRAWVVVSILACLHPAVGLAQSAIEHHVWKDNRTFEPLSRTAVAITGPVHLSGNPAFAEVGSRMSIAFGDSEPIEVVSVGASWREWGLSGETRTAEVFRMRGDPGSLLQGNTLCGEPSQYVVFSEEHLAGTSLLELAVFASTDPPIDINSPGLCATYTYAD